jgi:predicted Zn-dependent protease
LLIVVACATSPLGRKQFRFLPESQMNEMGAKGFDELKKTTPIETNKAINDYVNCIVKPITSVAADQMKVDQWEVVVFKNDQVNAFALPGGKIGVYTGILSILKTDGQLAAVLGHEVGHVIAQHGNERMSEGLGAQAGIMLLDYLLGKKMDPTIKGTILGAIGIGLQFGVLLPFSRTHESEADIIGIQLMAKAGFDPNQAAQVWRNMLAAKGGSTPIPEVLSTHPSDESRIANIESHLNEVMPFYQKAKDLKKIPVCVRP